METLMQDDALEQPATMELEKQHPAVQSIAIAQAAGKAAFAPAGGSSLNRGHPEGSALPSLTEMRAAEGVSRQYAEYVRGLVHRHEGQRRTAGWEQRLYALQATLLDRHRNAYATATNTPGPQRHRVLELFNATTEAEIEAMAGENLGLALRYANSIFYGTHLTAISLPDIGEMTDFDVLVAVNTGSWPSMHEGLRLVRGRGGTITHHSGNIERHAIGQFELQRLQQMGVSGRVRLTQVDLMDRMPTQIWRLRASDKKAAEAFKVNTVAYMKAVTQVTLSLLLMAW